MTSWGTWNLAQRRARVVPNTFLGQGHGHPCTVMASTWRLAWHIQQQQFNPVWQFYFHSFPPGDLYKCQTSFQGELQGPRPLYLVWLSLSRHLFHNSMFLCPRKLCPFSRDVSTLTASLWGVAAGITSEECRTCRSRRDPRPALYLTPWLLTQSEHSEFGFPVTSAVLVITRLEVGIVLMHLWFMSPRRLSVETASVLRSYCEHR